MSLANAKVVYLRKLKQKKMIQPKKKRYFFRFGMKSMGVVLKMHA